MDPFFDIDRTVRRRDRYCLELKKRILEKNSIFLNFFEVIDVMNRISRNQRIEKKMFFYWWIAHGV